MRNQDENFKLAPLSVRPVRRTVRCTGQPWLLPSLLSIRLVLAYNPKLPLLEEKNNVNQKVSLTYLVYVREPPVPQSLFRKVVHSQLLAFLDLYHPIHV